MNLKSITKSAAKLAVGAALTSTLAVRVNAATEPILFQDAVAAVGGSVTIAGGKAGTEYADGCGPAKAFDRTTYSTSDSDRWVASIKKNAFLSISAPSDIFIGKNVVLKSYTLYRLSVSQYNYNRAPAAWQILGRNSDDEEWQVIDERSGYDGWIGTPGMTTPQPKREDCVRSFELAGNAKSYVQYKYVPLVAVGTSGTSSWDTGLMELELYVTVSDAVSGDDKLVIASDLNAAGNPDPGYGSVSVGPGVSRTCRAGGPDFRDGLCYTCNGYSLATSTDGGQTWSEPVYHRGAGDEYVFTNEGTLTKLTWLWDVTAYKLTVTADCGKETFTYAPAPDFVDADGQCYYLPGKTVTVTPHAVTEPTASSFVKWENPPEGSTLSGDDLTLTMPSALLSVNARFLRHWRFVAAAESGLPADIVTDGNWQIYVTKHAETIDGVANPYRSHTPGNKENAVETGSGLLDFTTLNADLAAQGIEKPVKHIGGMTAANCQSLTELVVPADIPSSAGGLYNPFQGCKNLVSVTLYPDLTLWKNDDPTTFVGCFDGCDALVQVAMPNAKVVPVRLFLRCSALASVSLPAGITSIGADAFNRCVNLSSLTLPESLTEIGARAFFGTPKLTTLNMPPSLRSIGERAFDHADDGTAPKSGLSAFGDNVFPSTLETVGAQAFRDTKLAGTIDLSQTKIAEVPDACFARVPMTTLLLPQTVRRIGKSAFKECSELVSVRLPESVTNIDEQAFYKAPLRKINVPTSIRMIGVDAFGECDLSQSGDLVFPKGFASFGGSLSDTLGKALAGVKLCANIDLSRCANLTEIPFGTFARAQYVRITLPKSLARVGNLAFRDEEVSTRTYVPEIRFSGALPEFVPAPNSSSSQWKQYFGWRLLIRIPRSDPALTASWTSDPRFKPVSEMTNPEKNPNYETVSKVKGFLGEFDGSWVATWNDKAGGTMILIY